MLTTNNSHETLNLLELHKCLLCHDAPCSAACPAGDPARVLRSLRFDNAYGASVLWGGKDICANCSAPCASACPGGVLIPKLLSSFGSQLTEETPKVDAVDISTDICGVKLENPFLLSSSVVASNYEMCARAFDAGWAGVAFKTISLMDIHEASPRFSALKGGDGAFYGFKNIEQLSDHALEDNLSIFIKLKEQYPTKAIIASIMGRNEQEWEYLATAVTLAGADVIECNFSCPNMEDKGLGVDVGQSPDAVRRYTMAVRRGSKLPILAKMTPNVLDMRPAAKAAIEGGADGIAAINTIKSITNVNLDTYATAPAIKGYSSLGGYSGAAVKPIALRFISELGQFAALRDKHISGMGGIQSWRDAAEFLLLGARSLQITTAVMQFGYRIIDDLALGLKIFMAQRGYRHIDEFVGLALENIVDTNELERDTIIYPRFVRERCVGCGRCYISCRDGGHQALSFSADTRKPLLIGKNCVGCHLCVLVCPCGAISSSHKRVRK